MEEVEPSDQVVNWTFLTNHGRTLLCIGRDPGIRIREIAAALGITERRAQGIVGDLATSGYLVKRKDGRRNRYEIAIQKILDEPMGKRRTIGEVLDFLADVDVRWNPSIERRLGGNRRIRLADRRASERDRRSGLNDRRTDPAKKVDGLGEDPVD